MQVRVAYSEIGEVIAAIPATCRVASVSIPRGRRGCTAWEANRLVAGEVDTVGATLISVVAARGSWGGGDLFCVARQWRREQNTELRYQASRAT